MDSVSKNTTILGPKKSEVSSMSTTKLPARINLLQMCNNLKEIQTLHAQLIVSGLIHHPLNPGRLVESYVSTSRFDYALSVFNSIPSPDVFAYNTMIRGLMLSQFPDESFLLYPRLLSNGLKPDNHTFTFVLKTCSCLKALAEGKMVHAQIVKSGTMMKPNDHILSSLIHMYSNCGCIESAEQVLDENGEESILAMNSMITGYFNQGNFETAREIFDKMRKKDKATWSIMVTGYTKNNMHSEALSIFQEMTEFKVLLNESTLVSAVSACASLGALDQGKWIHRYITKNDFTISVSLGTALVDMYAKCGCIDFGYEVFRSMSSTKDVVTWSVIISGFSMNGNAEKCFQLFDEMVEESGITPNAITFIAILSACSHGGNVEMGFHYFNEMVEKFRIRPLIEHYGCIIDLVGRAGRLEDAEELISSMPEKPNAVIWGTLLSASRIYKDLKRGEIALEQLVELEPRLGDRYKLARNLFFVTGRRENAEEMWGLAEQKELLDMEIGLSTIDVAGAVHQFIAGDISHSNTAEIYEALNGGNR